MYISEVSICNQALGWLGENNIISFEDQNRNAQLCRDNYPLLRDAVISARFWRFATVRKTSSTANRPGDPNTDPNYPDWGDGYVHDVPKEMLQVFRAYTSIPHADAEQAIWQREGDYILSPEPILYLYGVRQVTDVRLFTTLFTQALAQRIAADLCIPITGNRSLQADHWTLYNDKLSEASVRDGQQGRAERTDANRLKNARRR